MTVRVLVYFTKGLGDVVLAEANQVAVACAVVEAADRYAVLEVGDADPALLRRACRTIDDVRLLVAGPDTVADPAALASLCAEAGTATSRLVAADGRDSVRTWSVTISARRPAWRDEPPWDPVPVIREQLPAARPQATSRELVDLRLQVDHDRASIGLSLPGSGPRRQDRHARPGGLRPSVAAALVRIAIGLVPPEVLRKGLYDPFCGSGTLLAEAAQLAGVASLPRLFGSDIDEHAVELTRQRIGGLRSREEPTTIVQEQLVHDVFVHDVRQGFPGRVSALLLVGNLPWGKQVKVDHHQQLFDAVADLTSHVVGRGGAGVFLTTNEDRLVARIRKRAGRGELSVRRIGLLGQTPAIVTARRAND
jgi:hypothetical protein